MSEMGDKCIEEIPKVVETDKVEIRGVIRLTDLLKNLALIKKYNFENTYSDEKIYLCADYIEKELLRLRYSDTLLDTEW